MTWALHFDGVNDRFNLNLVMPGDFEIRFKGTFDTFSKRHAIFGHNASFIRINSSTSIFVNHDGQNHAISVPSLSIDTIYEITLKRVSAVWSLVVDSVTYPLAITSLVDFDLTYLGVKQPPLDYYQGSCVSFECYGSEDRYFSADASDRSDTGVEPVFVDTIAGNNVTGVSFPTNGSAWVDLGGGTSYELAVDGGNYSYSGSSINLLYNRALTTVGGVYAYSGAELPLIYNRALSVDGGIHVYTGADLDLVYSQLTNYALSIDGVTYGYSGQSIPLLYSRSMPISGGDYSYTGGAVTLIYSENNNYSLSIDGSIYSYIGVDLPLLYSRKITVDGGVYGYSGSSVDALYNRSLSIDGESYNYTGAELPLLYSRSLTAIGGEYEYTGAQITITYSGQITLLIDCYSVEFKQDDVTLSYSQDNYGIEYGCL